MESSCGTAITFTNSFQMDSSTGITYRNNLNCNITITAPTGKFVVAQVQRFQLELAFSGTCPDYIEVYDGVDTSATKLNSDLICGSGSSNVPSNFTSTGESMTIEFITDATGTDMGFNMLFVAATSGVCASDQFQCNSSICIPASLDCDGYNQCGDNTDEDSCETKTASEGINILMVVLITLLVMLVVGAVVALIVYRRHIRNKWKRFVNGHLDDDDEIITPGPSYPITHKYYKGLRGHPMYSNEGSQPSESIDGKSDIKSSDGSASDVKA